MPAPLNVDKEAVRTLVVAVGVREAARQMGIPEPTVQAWSARGKWSAKVQAAREVIQQRRDNACNQVATKPADALAETLANDSRETKLGLSKGLRKAAKHIEESTGKAILAHSNKVKDIAGAANLVHGWQDQKQGGLTLNLGIMMQ